MSQTKLISNLVAAKVFLAALDPDAATFTFQTFPEGGHHDNPPGAAILHGSIDDVGQRLSGLNNAGHGIFVMVNEGDFQGRSARNVIRVRVHVLDLDGAPLHPVLDSELPPHIIVQSSPGKWHAYWRVDECPLGEFKARQHALAARFNGDMAVCDLPRVMRLPGFWHLKADKPFQTILHHPNDEEGQV